MYWLNHSPIARQSLLCSDERGERCDCTAQYRRSAGACLVGYVQAEHLASLPIPSTARQGIAQQCPERELPADVLLAIVDTNGLRFAAPLNDLVQATHHAFSRQREVHFYAQAFAIEVIQHVQCSDRTTIRELIRHKIHRPCVVWDLRHGQRFRFVPLEALLGLDP
jgi:hypothetical protein